MSNLTLALALELPTKAGAYTVDASLQDQPNLNLQQILAAALPDGVVNTKRFPSGLFGPLSNTRFLDAKFHLAVGPVNC